ncbi:hypothetical protein FOQG_04823 [Fusarium oxysporum f. sp. raphani 54005]|uniref:Uncharacterized protein n=1 Tax=Fusarium oxysporum f. sp. raphani 54005 TaxID=1089458 RepID=X0CH87_FUSOX|nr:hypothetical protein FOQG_04823 [Fusarium oxysporum f. sp. raphani 54005]
MMEPMFSASIPSTTQLQLLVAVEGDEGSAWFAVGDLLCMQMNYRDCTNLIYMFGIQGLSVPRNGCIIVLLPFVRHIWWIYFAWMANGTCALDHLACYATL